MGSQILSPTSTRRIASATGLNIIRALGHGGQTMTFITADHKHGWWNKATGDWGFYDDAVTEKTAFVNGKPVQIKDSGPHSSSCAELFPEWAREHFPQWIGHDEGES